MPPVAAASSESPMPGPAVLERIEIRPAAGPTVVFRLSTPTAPIARTLAAEGPSPDRIYIDLAGTHLGHNTIRVVAGSGPLRRVRSGQFDPNTVRVVLDLDRPLPFTVRQEGPTVIVSLESQDVLFDQPAAPVTGEAATPGPSAAVDGTPPGALASGPDAGVPTAAGTPGPSAEAPGTARTEPLPSSPGMPSDPGARASLTDPVSEVLQPPAAEPAAAGVVGPLPDAGPTAAAETPPEAVAGALSELPAGAATSTRDEPVPPDPTAPAAAEPTPASPPAVASAPPSGPPPEVVAEPPPPSARSAAPAAAPSSFPVIVLDAGHGGRDQGAAGIGGVLEKDVVLELTRRVALRLATRLPVTVLMTRTTDTYLPIEGRLATTGDGATLFLSLHANSCPDPTARGLELFYGGGTMRPASTRAADPRAVLLGRCLVDALRGRVGQVRSDPRPGSFGVLARNNAPSVLVEIGFLTHPGDAALAQDTTHQELLADALVDGIAAFLRAASPPL